MPTGVGAAARQLGTAEAGPGPAPVPRRRMRADDRREQLLDEAARLLVSDGVGSVTMERLAERAGVSKALPYRHFADSDAVLVALYRREATALGHRVSHELTAAGPDADLVQVSVRAYFDALAPRRAVLTALTSPGSAIPAMADPDDAGTRFSVMVLRRFHGLDSDRAKAVAGMVQGAIVGAASTYFAGIASRDVVERGLVRMIEAALG